MANKNERVFSGPLWPLLGFAAAGLYGFVVLPWSAKAPMADLTRNVDYRTWQVLIVLQACLWIYGATYAIQVIRRTPIRGRFPIPTYLAMAVLPFASVLPYFIDLRFGSPTGYDWSKSVVASGYSVPLIAGLLASFIVGAGIIRIHSFAESSVWKRTDATEQVSLYRRLTAYQERHLLILGGILAGMVIGTRGSVQAIKSFEGKEAMFPEQIWQLAVYWSALVAVVYLASRSSVRRIGRSLREELLAKEGDSGDGVKALERQQQLDARLGLDRGTVAELQSAFGVLSPIAGAIASWLLS